MSEQTIRPYSLLIYGLQDDFISVLKPEALDNKGHIKDPKVVLKNDGTQELTFNIPMYYTDISTGRRTLNPMWAKTRNAELLANLRKIKAVLAPTVNGERQEEILEFVITSKEDKHSNGSLECEIKCEGLAYRELGGTGYKLSLTQEDFLVDYNNWADRFEEPQKQLETAQENKAKIEASIVALEAELEERPSVADLIADFKTQRTTLNSEITKLEEQLASLNDEELYPEPHMSLNYWCDKVFDGSTAWTYRVEMNWDAYEDRDCDKIYEDEYISAWEIDGNNQLIPSLKEGGAEKYRAVTCNESNRYNITQDIAKAFGIYCRYEYTHDDNYHIIGRTAVFYNNFYQEEERALDVIYPNQISEVTRTIESANIVTKMYVKTIEDATQVSGIITIGDAKANKSGEDYILNFDYLKAVGSITDEQYEAVDAFEAQMHTYNAQITTYTNLLNAYKIDLTNYKAQRTNAHEAKTQAEENINEAQIAKAALIGDKGVLYVGTPEGGYSISSKSSVATSVNDITTGYNVRAKIPTGIDGVLASTIHLYLPPQKDGDTIKAKEISKSLYTIICDPDNAGVATAVDIKTSAFESTLTSVVYWSFYYNPTLKYDIVINKYGLVYAQQAQKYDELDAMVNQLESAITTTESDLEATLEFKSNAIKEFTRLMGPAIREGSWQDENYKDYGQKKALSLQVKDLTLDSIPFDSEQKNYEELGVELSKNYYPYIKLTSEFLDTYAANYLDKISLCYTVRLSGTNGQGEEIVQETVYTIGANAGMQYMFIEDGGSFIPALVITDCTHLLEQKTQNHLKEIHFAVVETEVVTKVDGYDYIINYNNLAVSISLEELNTVDVNAVYPRIQLLEDTLKTNSEKFSLRIGDKMLEKYVDYSILSGDVRAEEEALDGWVVTIKPEVILREGGVNWKESQLTLLYEISNACTSLYLDALEVMKTNSEPQISYSLNLSKVPVEILQTLPQYLNRVVNITDTELFLDEVHGYISEIEMNLDAPWEDKITTKDYKTKFEDLFSSIVASTEQMKANGASYDAAAAAFSVSGGTTLINEATLQHSINKYNLTQQFAQGSLTMSNENGIWAISDEGVVAMTGGGIFCATEKDAMGQWIWHTGLTPVGINASMITTGHLDTNLINIFAGDNIALQLNKEGLFAYKSILDNEGETTYLSNTYVVHNENGLFFTEDDVNRVEISWDGLKLRDSEGKETMYMDNDGNLVIKNAYIEDAKIGDLTIAELTQSQKGLNLYELNGTNFKYAANSSKPSPEILRWSIMLTYVHLVESDNLNNKYSVYITTEANPTDEQWTLLNLNNENCMIEINNLTFGVKYGIIPEGKDFCNIKVVAHCINDLDIDNTPQDYTQYLTVYNLRDGETPYTILITATNGNVFKNNIGSTTLKVVVLQNGTDVTSQFSGSNFVWGRILADGSQDESFNNQHYTGKSLTVTADSVACQATYYCNVSY